MSEEKEFEFVRGQMITNLVLVDYYQRTKELIKTLDEQIKVLEEGTVSPEPRQFKNPREEAGYLHDVKTLSVIKRQRERLTSKLVEIQERLQEDIDASKCVTPLKPLKKL